MARRPDPPWDSDSIENIGPYLDDLRTRDDMSLINISCARMQSLLEEALEKRLIPNRPNSKAPRIIPLGFDAVVSMSYRLGILNADFADSLGGLGSLRNKTAHMETGINLDSTDYQPFLSTFLRFWQVDSPKSILNSMYRAELYVAGGRKERAAFLVTATMFFSFLTAISKTIPPIDPVPYQISSLTRP